MYTSIDTIQEVLISSKYLDQPVTIEQIQQELSKYEQFALTKEGQQKNSARI